MPLEFLRPDFENELTASVDHDGQVLIGGTSFTPAAVLKADDAAFEAGFRGWVEEWVHDQRDRLDELLTIRANRKRFEDMCAFATQGSLVPFVGSGLSAPSGLPTWSAFLRRIREHSTLSDADLDALLAAGRYEEAAEALAATMPERLFEERIGHELRVVAGATISGAVRLLPMGFREVVITTNLDEVLEQVYSEEGTPFASLLIGTAIAEYRSGVSERPLLLKLHGTSRTTRDRVLIPAEYETAYGPEARVREELSLICRTQALLCLGCSLAGDRTVKLLGELAAADKDMPPNFALLRLPDTERAVLEREHFLTEKNIFPIWYADDDDEGVYILLVGLLTSMAALP